MRIAPAAHAAVPGPWGPVNVAVVPEGVVAVALLAESRAFAADLERTLHRSVVPRRDAEPGLRARLDEALDAVEAFFGGRRRTFDLPLVLPRTSDWDRATLRSVAAVPWGSVTSYGRVARVIGRTGAARAVGGAVGRNPISLLIPCHRVIAGDGSLGGYGGGWFGDRTLLLSIKRDLLEREGIALPARSFWDPPATTAADQPADRTVD